MKINDNAKLTNNYKDTINFDICRRISEEDIVDHILIAYYDNIGYWPSDYCNKPDIMLNVNRIHTCTNERLVNYLRSKLKPRFKLNVTINTSDNNIDTEVVHMYVDWGGQSTSP